MIDQISNLFIGFQYIYLVKLFLLVLGLFYFVFAAVVYRQVSLASQTIETGESGLIRLLAILQILGAVVVFALVILLV